MTEAYRVIVKVKNNLLHNLMLENGIKTQAELAREVGVCPTAIGRVANLKEGAFRVDGTQTLITTKLCEFFCCAPEDIYPEEVLHVGIPSNVVERAFAFEDVKTYLDQRKQDPQHLIAMESVANVSVEYLDKLLSSLPPKKEQIMRMHFIDQMTINKIAEKLGISRIRVHQIISNSLFRIRERLSAYGDVMGTKDYGKSFDELSQRLIDGLDGNIPMAEEEDDGQ